MPDAHHSVVEALQPRDSQLRALLDNSSDILYQFNLQTRRFEYMSRSIEQILGYCPEDLLAMAPDEYLGLIHPDDLALLGLCSRLSRRTVTDKSRSE